VDNVKKDDKKSRAKLEGSAKDEAQDAKKMGGKMSKKPKKGIVIDIKAKPMSKDEMSAKEKKIRESAGEPRKDIMPMKRRY